MVRCRALSSEEFRASVILLAIPDRRDTCCSLRGSQRRDQTRYAGNPCMYGRAEPPNLLLQIVGNPEVYAQQVYIRDIQIGVAGLTL